MPSKEHEEILQRVILTLANEGLRVIRLDSVCVPDAIAIDFENKKVTQLKLRLIQQVFIWLKQNMKSIHVNLMKKL
jgi:hypothetical protein